MTEQIMSAGPFVLAALLSYLIGSFPTGVVATKLLGAPDVRYSGSGNIGGTNTMRLTNVWVGTTVVVIDGLKGLLAWAVSYLILLGSGWALVIAGTFAVIGHCWPIYTRFRGGMGLATGGGLIFIITPITLLFIIPVWAFFYFIIFKKKYSPRSVALALVIGTALQVLFYPLLWHVRWFLVSMIPILFIKHLAEWNRVE